VVGAIRELPIERDRVRLTARSREPDRQLAMERDGSYGFVAAGWISSTSIQLVGYRPV